MIKVQGRQTTISDDISILVASSTVIKQGSIKIDFSSSFISDVDECSSDPCHNDGSCVDDINKYSCTCEAGYTGLQCETGTYVKQKFSAKIMHAS